MSDTKEPQEKAVRAGGGKTLSLQRTVEAGHVRQNFSHGRSKSVVVEKKKSRKIGGPGDAPAAVMPEPVARKVEAKAPPRPAAPAAQPGPQSGQLRQSERDARSRALAEAMKSNEAEEAERVQRALDAPPPAPAPTAPQAAPSKPAAEAPKSLAPLSSVPAAAAPSGSPAPARPPFSPAPRTGDRAPDRRPASGPSGGADSRGPARARPQSFNTAHQPREGGRPKNIEINIGRPPAPPEPGELTKNREARTETRNRPAAVPVTEDDDVRMIKKGGKLVRQAVKTTPEEKRERVKLTINNAFDQEQRERSLASLKRKREREKLKAMGIQQPRDKIMREVIIPEAMTIQELSNRMSERGVDVIKFLMKEGEMHKITDVIDADTAELIVAEFGHTAKRVSESDVEIGFTGDKDVDDHLVSRAPIVTIMGHVDHGKTSLLDAIRKTNVVSGEAGGITQHIGAYQVVTPSGNKVTFIDTPGHAAFTAMRARGAKATDIVVLVVAADDGVMPQTVEAINHAKSAGVPMIVAVNKIDKPGADPSKVRTGLLQYEIVVESMGGETLEVPVSALKGTNLDKLLEAIHLQAEILDLKANADRAAEGVVIEAKLEKGRGPVGTVLVQRGTLGVGDVVVAGTAWGRVRALIDDKGANTAKAGPSVPVEILGFDSAPEAGDQFAVVENEARAREITDYRIRKRRETLGTAGTSRTLEQMMQQLKEDGKKEFPLIIKGDVQGSIEAIAGSLAKLGTNEVGARLVHLAVGQITESDVALASAAKAIIVGFNVRANVQAKQAADQQGIEIRYYNIIYDLVDDVKAAMSGLLAPTKREVFLGYATIKQIFNVTKAGKVAGCIVTDGKVERGAKVRLLRDKVVIHEGTLSVLKRFKDDVREVPVGQECGMAFANYQDIREGDEIECFQVEIIQRSL